MNPESEDELMVVMKGAPERILSRCTKILVDGEDVDFDKEYRYAVNFANESLGKMGERVLAIARYKLEPKIYTKNPPYPFDVKNWKQWININSYQEAYENNIRGWFPM